MQPFREGINKFVDGHIGPNGIPEVRIYENAVLRLLNNTPCVPERDRAWRCYCVKFKKLPNVNWTTSRRLINGSLVCLWDRRNEVIIATVANR